MKNAPEIWIYKKVGSGKIKSTKSRSTRTLQVQREFMKEIGFENTKTKKASATSEGMIIC